MFRAARRALPSSWRLTDG